MALQNWKLCADIDFDNAILINLQPSAEVLITYSFIGGIHQNMLILSVLQDSGSFSHFLLAGWGDKTQAYVLSNSTDKKQIWYLSGWEVCQYQGTFDCPTAQLNIAVDPADSNKRVFKVACQIPSPQHRGDVISTVGLNSVGVSLLTKEKLNQTIQ